MPGNNPKDKIFNDFDVDALIGNIDKISTAHSFGNVDWQRGNWSLKIRFANNIGNKKKLLAALTFAKENGVVFKPIAKSGETITIEFGPSPDCRVSKLPERFASVFNQFLLPEERLEEVRIRVPEAEITKAKDEMDEAIAMVMDDVEGHTGLPIRTGSSPDISVAETDEPFGDGEEVYDVKDEDLEEV